MIAITLFGAITASFLLATTRSRELTDSQAVRLDLEAEVLDVIRTLRRELSRSGYASVDGNDWPVTFPAGASPLPEVVAPEPVPFDGVASTCMTFLQAQDADGDEWPDLDADHSVLWTDERQSLLLVPNAEGANDLVLRSTDGDERLLSRRASFLVCETTGDTQFQIPLRAVRIRFGLQRVEPGGRIISRAATEVVVLANGGMGL